MESYVMNQSKQLQELKNQTGFLNDSLTKLNAKVDSFATHNKMLESQISQVAQQVATSSQTPGIFSGQTEANPKAHVNAISLRNGRKLEDIVLKARTIEGESDECQGEITMIESKKQLHKSKIPLQLGLAKPCLEAQFKKFINTLKKICIKIPFAEALTRMPLYAKFIKKNFSKKKVIEHVETIALSRESSAIIKKLPPNLGDPGSFSIPCVIESEVIDKVMCDLGASISLLPLSLFNRIGIGELKPTEVTLKLVDRTNIHPVGFIEDIPIEIGGIYIPTNFIVLNMDEDDQVSIILGRPFLATARAMINVMGGMIAFRVSDEMVGFGMETVNKEPFDFSCCMIDNHSAKECFLASSTQHDPFDPF